jgi:hypothetical protein
MIAPVIGAVMLYMFVCRQAANDGSYTDSTGDTGRARYAYKVCEANTQTCSNVAKVTFQQ